MHAFTYKRQVRQSRTVTPYTYQTHPLMFAFVEFSEVDFSGMVCCLGYSFMDAFFKSVLGKIVIMVYCTFSAKLNFN